MTNIATFIYPTYSETVLLNINKKRVLEILKNNITDKSIDDDMVYKGIVNNDNFTFSKRDITATMRSEITFTGIIEQIESNNTLIKINSRYKTFAIIGYIVVILFFSISLFSFENFFQLLIPIIPYLFMVIKIKYQSAKIIKQFKILLK
jgi:hypothetical protein